MSKLDTNILISTDDLPSSRKRRFGCLSPFLPFIFIGGIILSCMGLIFACGIISGVVFEHTWLVPGDSSKFDPVASYEEVRSFAASDAQLVSIDATYVRSDGTLDLNASYKPRVTYDFVRELANPPADAPPIGAGGNPDGKWYEDIEVDLYEPWSHWHVRTGNSEYDYTNLGMDRDTGSTPTLKSPGFTVDAPACSFKQLWSIALEHGAKVDAVAIIRYDEDGYNFSISDLSVYLDFDKDCSLES
ncbi:MAG TPA: hypothetical protein VHL11_02380 [Phototrophicaceae bacterium]|nr:hypothetical protein [Phototrophicaceae bacterium]